ncbi:MAG: hypothetical protein AAFY15_12115 [Cyanobacteria bacterium J06648_11]
MAAPISIKSMGCEVAIAFRNFRLVFCTIDYTCFLDFYCHNRGVIYYMQECYEV